MKNPYLASFFSLLLATCASAQYYANFGVGSFTNPFDHGAPTSGATLPTDKTKTGSFGFAPGSSAASGFFTASTAVTGGTGWGISSVSPLPVGPTGMVVDPATLNPSFTQNFSSADLTVLAFYGSEGSTVTTTLNFSGLPGGVLKAGSAIAWSDVDGLESATFSSTVSDWYSLSPSGFFQADMTKPGADPTGSTQPDPSLLTAASTIDAQTMKLLGGTPGVFTNTAVNFIILQKDLTDLTIVSKQEAGGEGIQFYQSFAIATDVPQVAVPESSSAVMAGLSGLGFLLLRRRNR